VLAAFLQPLTAPLSSYRAEVPESALGHVHQITTALQLALEQAFDDDGLRIFIERYDDVALFGTNATRLNQLKHHVNTAVALSDAHPDLWKSIRSWLDALNTIPLQGFRPVFLISTTCKVSPYSAPSYLGAGANRNVARALELLSQTASSSRSASLQEAFSAFRQLDIADRHDFVSNIYVLDEAPNINQVQDAIQRLIRVGTSKASVKPFYERLRGWWLGRVVDHLQTGQAIHGSELIDKFDDLREQMSMTNLPIDDDVVDIKDVPAGFTGAERRFVEQLRWIAVRDTAIASAIRDYHRAYVQRSRWVGDKLLNIAELRRYERKLVDAWRNHFDLLETDSGSKASELQKWGRDVYRLTINEQLPIRKDCTEGFIARGSLHILADDGQVGWHPQFLNLLADAIRTA
jgi:hypothetical protein